MPSRQRSDFTKRQGLSDLQWRFLRGEELPDTFDAFILEHDIDNTNKQLWHAHEDEIVAEFAKENPGKRPALWWTYSAPRSPIGAYKGCAYGGELPEPRKRLGGIGTPAHEVLNIKPSFSYGIPNIWISPTDVDYYSGTMVNGGNRPACESKPILHIQRRRHRPG